MVVAAGVKRAGKGDGCWAGGRGVNGVALGLEGAGCGVSWETRVGAAGERPRLAE